MLVKAYEDRQVEATYGMNGYPTLVFARSGGEAHALPTAADVNVYGWVIRVYLAPRPVKIPRQSPPLFSLSVSPTQAS